MAKRKHRVQFKVTAPLLRHMFRLDESMTILGASFADNGLVTFTVEAPDAPAGAAEMVPVYHNNGRPDPVHLIEVRWLHHDGSESVQHINGAEHGKND